jgi:hypothetical protein
LTGNKKFNERDRERERERERERKRERHRQRQWKSELKVIKSNCCPSRPFLATALGTLA